jgi:hypothetical protein
LRITNDFQVSISTPAASATVRMDRISLQHLAATISAMCGPASKGIQANAGLFKVLPCDSVVATPPRSGPVRLSQRSRRGTIKL